MTGKINKMAYVNGINGPIDINVLGRTLMHEHVFTFHSDMFGDYKWKDEEKYVTGAIDKFRRLKRAGFETIVDLTVFGLGRNVSRVQKVAAAADFNIIVATGIYANSEMPVYFRVQLRDKGPSFLENLFVQEIEEGIADTRIRASILKCVIDSPGLTPDVNTIVRSVARAHLRTGVPISTHSDASSGSGLLQQEVFRQEGVDLSHVIIGHCGDTTDLIYLERLIEAGSYIGMDRFGNYQNCSFENRLNTVAALCRKGYASQILLSHDANCGGDLNPEWSLKEWRYGEIAEKVIPALRDRGVTNDDIDTMTIRNARAIFEAAAAARTPLDSDSKT